MNLCYTRAMLYPREMFWWLRGWIRRDSACGTKIRYSRASAKRAKAAMERKHGKLFDVYPCLFCGRWHIGGSVKNRRRK